MVNCSRKSNRFKTICFFFEIRKFFFRFLRVHFSFQLSVGFVLILKRLVAIFGYCSRSAALPQWLSLLSFRFSVKDKDKGLILQ